MQSYLNTPERRWAAGTIQDGPCSDFWPTTSPSLHVYPGYYHDYNPRSESYDQLLNPSPPLSPCLSPGSTGSSPPHCLWDTSGLYVLDDDQHRHFSSSNPSDSDPEEMDHDGHDDIPTKSEPINAAFIIEAPVPHPTPHYIQPLAAAAACPPLRATHASDDMKKMMSVFRLDPFIFKGVSWKPEVNTGLKGDSKLFEFYLESDLDNSFDQCMYYPQPAYKEKAVIRNQPRAPSYSNHPTTYAHEGEWQASGSTKLGAHPQLARTKLLLGRRISLLS